MGAVNWLPDPAIASNPDGGTQLRTDIEAQQWAVSGSIVAPLPHLGCIRVTGAEAEPFLQGQLSNDVAMLAPGRAQLSSFNSAKGRVLNVFLGVRTPGGILLETRAALIPETLKRLRMYVMRSKVVLDDMREELPSFGVSGSDAPAAIAALGFAVPSADWDVSLRDTAFVVRRPGPVARFTVHAPPPTLRTAWAELTTRLRPVGPDAWRLLEILSGLPSVVPATQDHFVAQMLNLDRLGGISFTKGCYTGQEVVARLHYLGTVKRQMLLAFTPSADPSAGMPIVVAGDGSSVGEVVEAAPHPQRGSALLVVMQKQHAQSTELRLGRPDGAPIAIATQWRDG